MAKYKVEVGGYASVFRQRNLIIHADNEEQAKDKAIDKFMLLQQQRPGDLCSEGHVDSIERMD